MERNWCIDLSLYVDMQKKKYNIISKKTKEDKYLYLMQQTVYFGICLFDLLSFKHIFFPKTQEIQGQKLFLQWIECKFSYRVYGMLPAWSVRCLTTSHWSAGISQLPPLWPRFIHFISKESHFWNAWREKPSCSTLSLWWRREHVSGHERLELPFGDTSFFSRKTEKA